MSKLMNKIQQSQAKQGNLTESPQQPAPEAQAQPQPQNAPEERRPLDPLASPEQPATEGDFNVDLAQPDPGDQDPNPHFSFFGLDPDEFPETVRGDVAENLKRAQQSINAKFREAADQRKGGEDVEALRQELDQYRQILNDPSQVERIRAYHSAGQGDSSQFPNPYTDTGALDESQLDDEVKNSARMVRALAFDTVTQKFLGPLQQEFQRLRSEMQAVAGEVLNQRNEQVFSKYAEIPQIAENRSQIVEYATKHRIPLEQAVNALHANDLIAAASKRNGHQRMSQPQQQPRQQRAPQPNMMGNTRPHQLQSGGGTLEENLERAFSSPAEYQRVLQSLGSSRWG